MVPSRGRVDTAYCFTAAFLVSEKSVLANDDEKFRTVNA